MWQAEFVKRQLESAHPGIEVELLGLTTQGDRWLGAPLSEVGGKGLFVKELEQAMLDGRADAAVHSMKDLPAFVDDAFVLPAIGFRADVRDVVVSRGGARLDALPARANVGSSSLRRSAQMLAVRPDLVVSPVRGNVETRLKKLDNGDYDALVLAAAGLDRLGLGHRITERLPLEVSLPAAGQGALGVECLAVAKEVMALLGKLDDPVVSRCVTAERAVSRALGADCSLPIAAHARLVDDRYEVKALLASPDGKRVLRSTASDVDPERAGSEAARRLLDAGGVDILAGLAHASRPH